MCEKLVCSMLLLCLSVRIFVIVEGFIFDVNFVSVLQSAFGISFALG